MRIGICGANGYWGPNHVRVVKSLGHDVLTCDMKGEADYRDYRNKMFESLVDAIIVATPPSTHYDITKHFLEKKIPCLVEKPMATTGPDAYKLLKLAKKNNTKLMVGHTYLHSPAYNKLTDLLTICGEGLGKLEYVDVQWKNLGKFQMGGVIQDLLPHPLSIILHLLDIGFPKKITSTSYCHKINGISDTALISLEWEDVQANINLSWMDPQKTRIITFIFTNGMIVWDDTSSLDKLKTFDKSISFHDNYDSFGTFQTSYRYGDTIIHKLDTYEPLVEEIKSFLSVDPIDRSADIGHIISSVIQKCR